MISRILQNMLLPVADYSYTIIDDAHTIVTENLRSALSLHNSRPAQAIIGSLAEISLKDYLPATMLIYMLNKMMSHLFDDTDDTAQSLREDPILMVVVGIFSMALFSIALNRIMRGVARSIVLTNSIPLILNEQYDSPHLSTETSVFDYLSERSFEQRRIVPSSVYKARFNMEQERLVPLTLSIISKLFSVGTLPSSVLATIRLGIGFFIAEQAIGTEARQLLRNRQINSVHALTAFTYCVTGSFIDTLLQGMHPMLRVGIQTTLLMWLESTLLAMISNISFNTNKLHSGSFGYMPDLVVLLTDGMIQSIRKTVRHMLYHPEACSGPAFQYSIYLLQKSVYFLKASKILPRMLRSPELFFQDELVDTLLKSVSSAHGRHILGRYSSSQLNACLQITECLYLKTRQIETRKFQQWVQAVLTLPALQSFENARIRKLGELGGLQDSPQFENGSSDTATSRKSTHIFGISRDKQRATEKNAKTSEMVRKLGLFAGTASVSPASTSTLSSSTPSSSSDTRPSVTIPESYICSLTYEPMREPVLFTVDGRSYEKAAITEWLSKNRTSPHTRESMKPGETLQNVLIFNRALADAIEQFRHENPALFAEESTQIRAGSLTNEM